jgi:flagellar hook protein FlgE
MSGGGDGISCTLDKDTGCMVITFTDTGATLTLDISDTQVARRGDTLGVGPGETLDWNFPPSIFEEGTYKIHSESIALFPSGGGCGVQSIVEKDRDGSLTGLLDSQEGVFSAEFYFNEEGRVSGYKFTRNAGSFSDPSVGVVQTGSLVEGVRFIRGDTDYGTFNIDLSAMRIINRTGTDLTVNGSTIKPVTSSEGTGSARTASGTPSSGDSSAMVSPSSLSVDENGVLRRLKDNGDWEPVYLLACGQFAAMNSAEERNGVYYATPASGALRMGVSGKDGMGTITSGTLERSTTDLAHELSTMIRAQHAYAANTKVLSTLDDMLEELERL